MKLKHIFAACIAVLGLMSSCSEDQELEGLDNIQVSKSELSIPVEGGSVEFKVKAKGDWKIQTYNKKGELKDSIPAWLTATPDHGSVGETTVNLTAKPTNGANSSTIMLACNGQVQYVNVVQGILNPPFSTCKEVIAGADGATYKVKGKVTKIANTTYGNWYLKDETGEIYIYGTLDANGGEKNFASLGIEEGDEVTVQGPKTTYGSTVELVNVTVLSHTKSLVKVDSVENKGQLPKNGGDLKVMLTVKGGGVTVDIPEADQDWLSMKGLTTSGTSAVVTLKAKANAGGARTSTVNFTSSANGQTSTVSATISQEGAIVPMTVAEFNKAEVGESQYRLTGVISDVKNTDYGNFTLSDYSGSIYVHGLGAKGDFSKLGLKAGDIVTIIAQRGEYKGEAQAAKSQYVEHYAASSLQKLSVADFRAAAENKDKFYLISGTIMKPTESGTKFDLETYGNFALKDATGQVYVYGLKTGWNGESKQAAKMGLKEGDKITIIGYRTSYKGLIQVGGGMFYTKD